MSIDDDVLFGAIGDVRQRMEAGEFGPIALTEALLMRIERLQNSLNSFITVTDDIACREAESAEASLQDGRARGPLHGIPLAYKDLLATAGTRTTFASRAYANWTPDYDATQVRRFREAGAIMLGKLNLSEGASDSSSQSSAFGGPRNPWDLERITGGSSGGSAAAVAAGLAFGTIGSDTAMSIRQPAALCGIVGLKPTYGRVSKHGAMALSFSLDHLGPMTRTVRDNALMLQVMAGHDPDDPTTVERTVPDYVAAVDKAPERLEGVRIGIPRRPFYEGLADGWDTVIEAALEVFASLGATLEEFSLPHAQDLNHIGSLTVFAEGAAFHADAYRRDPTKFGPGLRALIESGQQLGAVQYIQTQRLRRKLCDQALAAMAPYDAVLLPTTPLPACRIDEDDPNLTGPRLRNTLLFNVLGVPALSIPCGFDGTGMPVGLQMVGRGFGEDRLLALARVYERETEWHLRRPPN
jgi:aspartyl-tRNA(Asn)/glutamyl-tRNA(Gln) amidotransferase subunit A